MNSKKILILLIILIVYVNFMNQKKDISKMEKSIINTQNRINKEDKLFKEKSIYQDINTTRDYSYLFYDGKKLSYSESMGLFQQDIQASAKKVSCSLGNTNWQDMPINKNRWYDILSLRVTLECKPKAFLNFIDDIRDKFKLFSFSQLHLSKDRRKNSLHISATISAYRSKKSEK